jgi:hypothetical protein
MLFVAAALFFYQVQVQKLGSSLCLPVREVLLLLLRWCCPGPASSSMICLSSLLCAFVLVSGGLALEMGVIMGISLGNLTTRSFETPNRGCMLSLCPRPVRVSILYLLEYNFSSV